MSMRTTGVLQWVGLFVAPLAWLGQHLVGQAITQARCSEANATWGISNTAWQIGLLVGAAVLILASEAAAVTSYLRTREGNYESAPPLGRIQLVSVASMTTNLLFLVIVLLDGVASIIDIACRQS
jgi:hypothetical protein